MTSPSPYSPRFSYTMTPAKPAKITTSRTELTQLGIAFAVLTLDFTLILGAGGFLFTGASGFLSITPAIVLVSATAGLTAFVAHEMAHKVSAQRNGCWAEFRMAPMWLLISIFTAFLGFLWAAPGATVVGGMTDPREWGRTSLAGPLANIGFSAAFFAAAVGAFEALGASSPVWTWLIVLGYLNGWFGTFNLLPFGPLDGRKVFAWSKETWTLSIVVAGALAVVCYASLFFGTPILAR
jgi:Zn-dependent protease